MTARPPIKRNPSRDCSALTRISSSSVIDPLEWLLVNPLMRRRDKASEQRVRLGGFAVELGMKLAADEKRMLGQLDDFDPLAVRRGSPQRENRLFETLPGSLGEFDTMPVPF